MAISLHTAQVRAGTDRPGAPLLIAHGFLGQGRNFGTLARAYSKKRRIISVDMRNHGASPWHDVMDYDAMAEDLAAVIRTECHGHAHILGHSMGGKAAMVLALQHPELLASLTVADIAPVAYDHDYSIEINAMRETPLDGVTRRSEADRLLSAAVPDAAMRAFFLQNLSVSEGTARWKPNLDVLYRALPQMTGWPQMPAGARYDGPVLFVRGGNSPYVQDQHKAGIFALFPRVEYATVEGAGHWLHAEQPEAFFTQTDGFLDRTAR